MRSFVAYGMLVAGGLLATIAGTAFAVESVRIGGQSPEMLAIMGVTAFAGVSAMAGALVVQR